jgi:hypothetical protein
METKKQSPEKSCLPTAATLPSAMNGNFGTSPLKKMGGTLTTWQPISHGRAWQTVRVVVHLEAVANSISWILSGRRGRILFAFVVIL